MAEYKHPNTVCLEIKCTLRKGGGLMEKKVVAIDHDGTLSRPIIPPYNPSLRLPALFLLALFCPQFHLIFSGPNTEGIEAVKKLLENGNRVVDVSARPKQFTELTRQSLNKWGIPIEVICVGPQKDNDDRKLAIFKMLGVKIYIDNTPKRPLFFKDNGIEILSTRDILRAY
jgi:hypothetical protein